MIHCTEVTIQVKGGQWTVCGCDRVPAPNAKFVKVIFVRMHNYGVATFHAPPE